MSKKVKRSSEESDGWSKILVLGLMLALGLAGFFGWNAFKDFAGMFNNPTEQVIDDATKAIEDGKQVLEEQKQEVIDQGNAALDKGKQALEDGKKSIEDAKEEALNIINTYRHQ